ncbi:response regulator [Cesiribacter sp. SM1]|uniref:response regulator n=1 Tax=Cesiribacter sp. SM1 TaxID=2861196 RepID=UPI001CD7CFA6|nr:response regulator [Cesiribacter sp. SM1]
MHTISCILLVDDDIINNFINQQLIEDLEITGQLSVVNNGLEAIRYLEKNAGETAGRPDLVLLDINMPVMDGFEFLKEFHSMQFPDKEKVKIVMLTTSTSDKDVQRLKEIRVDGYIHKPLTEEKMMGIVNEFFTK